ncbi:MAG: heavy metal-binding domain-containing protein [Ferruginibacter sp.]
MKFFKILIVIFLIILAAPVFAQDTTNQQAKEPGKQAATTKYVCPMHADITSNKPGKCSKCGMALVKVKNPAKKTYSCPMHPEVTSDKPGKCPKCKMDLKEKKQVRS